MGVAHSSERTPAHGPASKPNWAGGRPRAEAITGVPSQRESNAATPGGRAGLGDRPPYCRDLGSAMGGRRPQCRSAWPILGCHNGLMAEHYQRPGWFTTNVFNRVVAALTRLGVSVYGSRVLEVKGRKSGEWRQTPVNLLRYQGADFLVAPRGHTQWVKNLRASGQGRLRVGRRTQAFSAVELTDDDKPPLLRAYLKKWKFEVGVFFGGVGPDSPDDDLRRIAPDHPVFRLTLT
jgi:deazaflavin-dependent oxidoreductase (nitroreductase family)